MGILKHGVSVVVCCCNSSSRVPETLGYLTQQQVSKKIPWEVIVVDNASTDQTLKVARDSWPKNTPCQLRIVKEPKLGLSYARTKGLKEAKYEFVSFVDDDNLVYPNWVETVFQLMKSHPEVGACGGMNKPKLDINAPWWFKTYKKCYAVGKQSNKAGDVTWERGFIWGAGMTIRKSAWRKLFENGFRFILSGGGTSVGEDSELCFALRLAGWKIWYEPKLQLEHHIAKHRLSWRHLRQMYRSFGVGRAGHDPYFFGEKPEPADSISKFSQTWYGQAFLIFENLLKKGWKVPASFIFSFEGNNDALEIEHSFGRIHYLLTQRNKYNQAIKEVRQAPWNKILENKPAVRCKN